MRPGSLRVVGLKGMRDRVVQNFTPEQTEEFYGTLDSLESAGYKLYYYEMTDKGWTEF